MLKLIVVLESYISRGFKIKYAVLCLLNTHKKFFIIPEAGVTTKIMCYLCSRMSPHWMDECSGKGKVNLKTEIEVLEMGIILATKEAHFVCKSKCYGKHLKHQL